ncbi:hypothetical protein AAFC00_005738 [Neodothiora populina]|uniref:DUF300-domain-containing protein n=1 Tax=Neodothiora populina TaxID=2781224 RepID=A0ABR3P5V3_9PEZI
MPFCNTTTTETKIEETPLFGHVQFHHVGLIISALFALISVIIAFFLMQKHATHYSKPNEQRHIIRIILMLPVYSTVSFLSYLYYEHSVYFEVIRDCYEAFAIASFFTLLCNYIAPTLHGQKDYFRTLTPINWFWGVFGLQKCTGGEDKGFLRRPRSGLTWFNVVWIGVFQYCFIRVFFTIVSVITEATGRYCETSLNPAFAHIWVMVFEGVAVTFAMFFLIQFYLQLKRDLAEHKPFLKVICIKMVIFFSFWQSLLISFLSSSGALKTSDKLASQDIKIGIPSMLLCIEMAIFAVMHLFAFPWREYDLTSKSNANPILAAGSGWSGPKPEYKGGKFGTKAWVDAFNPWDIIKASARGFRWLFVGRKSRHHDISYKIAAEGANTNGSTLDSPATSIPGPNVMTQHAPSATELQQGGRGRSDTAEADDRAGLLSHAQEFSPTDPYGRSGSFNSQDETDIGHGGAMHMPPSVTFPEADAYGGRSYGQSVVPQHSQGGINDPPWDADTAYHAAPSAPSSNVQGGGATAGDSWNHWAGAGGAGPNGRTGY